jgi:hypothetical protein
MLARLREGAGALRPAAEAHVEFARKARSPARAGGARRGG